MDCVLVVWFFQHGGSSFISISNHFPNVPWQACVLQTHPTRPAYLSCRTFFLAVSAVLDVPVLTAESFLSGLFLSYGKCGKDFDDIQTWKTCQNTEKLLKSGSRSPDERRWCCQAAHEGTNSSFCAVHDLFLSRKNPTKKTSYHCFKKEDFGDALSIFWGPYFFYSHGYKVTFLTATKLFKGLLFWILHFPSVSLFCWPLA